MDAGFRSKYTIDPVTKEPSRFEMNVINGESIVKTVTKITGDTAYFSSLLREYRGLSQLAGM